MYKYGTSTRLRVLKGHLEGVVTAYRRAEGDLHGFTDEQIAIQRQ